MRLTDRQFDVLRWLDDKTFQTPRAIGGFDGSHHSATLARLAKRGLVERRKLHAIYCCFGTREMWSRADGKIVRSKKPITLCRCKGSCRYRRTRAGRAAVRARLDPVEGSKAA